MGLPAQKFREAVFQILFSKGFGSEKMIAFMMKELSTTRKEMEKAEAKAEAILEKKEEIDAWIKTYSHEYRLERIGEVEKAILRLGFFELFFEGLLAKPIVLAEAIRLCRKFSTRESSQFINAVLDAASQRDREALSANS